MAVHQELGLGMEQPAEVSVNMPLEAAPPAASDPDPKTSPEAATETADDSDSTPAPVAEAPVAPAADLSAPVGAEAAGDEPPF